MNLKNSLLALKKNPLGFVIFGLGVLAFVIVCFFAFNMFNSGNNTKNTGDVSKEEVEEFRTAQADKKSESKSQQSFKRQKKIKEQEIVGAWDASLGNARALLQLKEGTFRLIVIDRSGFNMRHYINGNYSLEGDILMLDPDVRSLPPSDKYNYQLLTRASLPAMVSKHKGKMVWQIPDDDADIYVPNNHAILDRVPNKIVVWSVLK